MRYLGILITQHLLTEPCSASSIGHPRLSSGSTCKYAITLVLFRRGRFGEVFKVPHCCTLLCQSTTVISWPAGKLAAGCLLRGWSSADQGLISSISSCATAVSSSCSNSQGLQWIKRVLGRREPETQQNPVSTRLCLRSTSLRW